MSVADNEHCGSDYLADLDIRNQDFRHIRIENRELERVRLSGVLLNGSVLSDCHLLEVLVHDCDLTHASFQRCSFTRVRFRDCRLDRAEFVGTTRSDMLFESSSMKNTSFRFERLGTEFKDCNLTGADFTETDLSASGMSGCELREAQMFKANTQGLDLRTNDIAGIRSVDHLKGAMIDSYQLLDLAAAMAKRIGIVVEEALPPD